MITIKYAVVKMIIVRRQKQPFYLFQKQKFQNIKLKQTQTYVMITIKLFYFVITDFKEEPYTNLQWVLRFLAKNSKKKY